MWVLWALGVCTFQVVRSLKFGEDTSKLMRFLVCLLIYVWVCVYISISMSISVYLPDLKVCMSRLWGYWALGGSFHLFWNLWPVWEDVPKYKLSDLLMGICCKISGLWLVSGSFFPSIWGLWLDGGCILQDLRSLIWLLVSISGCEVPDLFVSVYHSIWVPDLFVWVYPRCEVCSVCCSLWVYV